MTVSMVGELVVCVAACAMWFVARYRRRTVERLRTSLRDAAFMCDDCDGTGVMLTAGATLKCVRCSKWRQAIHASEHWLNG